VVREFSAVTALFLMLLTGCTDSGVTAADRSREGSSPPSQGAPPATSASDDESSPAGEPGSVEVKPKDSPACDLAQLIPAYVVLGDPTGLPRVGRSSVGDRCFWGSWSDRVLSVLLYQPQAADDALRAAEASGRRVQGIGDEAYATDRSVVARSGSDVYAFVVRIHERYLGPETERVASWAFIAAADQERNWYRAPNGPIGQCLGTFSRSIAGTVLGGTVKVHLVDRPTPVCRFRGGRTDGSFIRLRFIPEERSEAAFAEAKASGRPVHVQAYDAYLVGTHVVVGYASHATWSVAVVISGRPAPAAAVRLAGGRFPYNA
jgi:hypothetical protein